MAEITAQMVKELRERTAAGMMDCKKALVETDGDMKAAIEFLQVKGLAAAAKRAGRSTKEGFIGSYIHHDGKTGVLIEVNCETDFVARNEKFREFAKQIAMHIAAAKPEVVSSADVDAEMLASQRRIFEAQAAESGKPEAIVAKMVDGKVAKWLKEISLLDQPFVMDPDKTIEQYRAETSGFIGENIVIGRFTRIAIAEKSE
ncbi:MAG: translation elongation factor Ts [Myxococcota bacterium]|jgi:elongation factor Ts|nr:translation elongation factor Ts [Myxococcota bacterium]